MHTARNRRAFWPRGTGFRSHPASRRTRRETTFMRRAGVPPVFAPRPILSRPRDVAPLPASDPQIVSGPAFVARVSSPPSADDAPLPRARSLALVRRQGLIDAIGLWLRDTGRWLARWSARRQKTRRDQHRLAQASARHRALQSQMEALAAIRESVPGAD